MKSLFIVIMLFPVLLFSQNVGIGTVVPQEKLEVNGIIFTSQGGVRFPDGTLQTTAYVPSTSMMDMNLSGIVIEFESSVDVFGPAQGDGITNGINVSSGQEGVGVAVQVSPGMTISGGTPSLSEFTFSRVSDANSAQIRSLVFAKTLVPYIEVFYLSYNSGTASYWIDHIIRYEDCMMSSISKSSSGDFVNESVSFAFTRACYRSYERDENGVAIRTVNTCFDQSLTNQSSLFLWPILMSTNVGHSSCEAI